MTKLAKWEWPSLTSLHFPRPPDKSPFKKKKISTKTYVVGTQKNRPNETVLLITQNKH